ncbi:hypothetical protein [Bacillus phage Baseball_field]|uniref:Uncharacterized protein n=1 Tax=Bacillus phage Baseball_field TaxID=2756144 RepID=A0A7L7SKD1_9CAUD|nr:hypothetical protein KNV63_gp19 [Bacillus phage Baseball_field]QOC56883.1 hypothetical protein [Bacillus phage Baseball_field]
MIGGVGRMEVKIEVASILSDIEPYLPVLKEYDYKEGTGTIYLTHLHDIFDLQNKLEKLNLNTALTPSIIVTNDKLIIYDDWIE